jgi:isopenicillin N synthase-like dioxygenase
VAVEKSICDRGWFDIGIENLDPDKQKAGDLKEGYRIGNDLPPRPPSGPPRPALPGPNQWPTDVPGFRETMEAYFAAVHGLAAR